MISVIKNRHRRDECGRRLVLSRIRRAYEMIMFTSGNLHQVACKCDVLCEALNSKDPLKIDNANRENDAIFQEMNG